MGHPLRVLALGLGLLAACRVSADDWLMHRKDAGRTAASNDRIRGPLTEVWSAKGWTERATNDVQGVPVWKGRAFYHRRELHQSAVACVDARTGVEQWAQPGYGGVTVTGGGYLFTYRKQPLLWRLHPSGAILTNARVRMSECIQAYDSITGRPLAYHPLDRIDVDWTLNQTIARVLLADDNVTGQTVFGDRRCGGACHTPMLGPPLAIGGEFVGLSDHDQLFRWGPGGRAVSVTYGHAPPNLLDPDAVPAAHFGGYPLALSDSGLVVASDNSSTHGLPRWMAMIDGGTTVRWHREMPWTIGAPTTSKNVIYVGLNTRASAAIMAIDAGTGVTKWVYAPRGLMPAPVGTVVSIGIDTGRGPFVPFVGGPVPGNSRTASPIGGQPQLSPGNAPNPFAPGSSLPRTGQGTTQPPRAVSPGAARPTGPTSGQTSFSTAFPTRDLRRDPFGVDNFRREATFTVRGGTANGHIGDPGPVLKEGRVYARVAGAIVALDAETGRPIWRRPVVLGANIGQMLATRDHLLVQVSSAITSWFALRLEDGKLEWTAPLPLPGAISAGRGMAFVADGESIHAFAPAERTFRIAVDSPAKDDYAQPPVEDPEKADEKPEEKPADAAGKPASPDGAPGGTVPPLSPLSPADGHRPRRQPPAVADATVLRLSWGETLEESVRKARARREVAGSVPMLLSYDWLDPLRAKVLSLNGEEAAPDARAFAEACGRLAAAVQPEHFDLAPEVNVYLARYPHRLDAVAASLRAARDAVRKASPSTRVLVSFNAEVLTTKYGLGGYAPFGKLTGLKRADVLPHGVLVDLVDELGLTSYPQSAFTQPFAIPGDYFLAVRQSLRDKPLLITRLGVGCNEKYENGPGQQAAFLKRMIQLCYWINSPLVAYPDLSRKDVPKKEPDEYDLALRVGSTPRIGMMNWWDTYTWRRVDRLSADDADPGRILGEPGAEKPAAEKTPDP